MALSDFKCYHKIVSRQYGVDEKLKQIKKKNLKKSIYITEYSREIDSNIYRELIFHKFLKAIQWRKDNIFN